MSLFIPKRLIIKPQSKHSQITRDIITRTQTYNPRVEIEYLNTKDFKYPVSGSHDMFHYMKESAIVSERSESFIRTFDSPGNIVESLITVLNLTWMCANQCEYCYLQTNQTPEHYFYTNLRDAEHEIASSQTAHTAILTLWTHLSEYFGQRLLKLPDRFKETSDWMREFFVNARITTESTAIDRYYLMQDKLVKQLNKENKSYKVEIGKFKRDKTTIKEWYNKNQIHPLRLTASEFNDFLAVDHLTNNSTFLMHMLEKYPPFTFSIRSKSSYVDGFLPYDGLGRAEFQIALNTDYVIKEHEHGTAMLDDRIHAARKIQEARGYRLSLVFEPMLTYDNYLEEYQFLIEKALRELDPARIFNIYIGSMRFTPELRSLALSHFPSTKLFNEDQHYCPPVDPDTKNRYLPDVRKLLYSTVINKIKSIHNIPIGLGTELPEMWKDLNMNVDQELKDTVFEPVNDDAGLPTSKTPAQTQIDEVGEPKSQKQKIVAANKEPLKKKNVESNNRNSGAPRIADNMPHWFCIAPQDTSMVEAILGKKDDLVPLEKFAEAVDILRNMAVIKIHRDEISNEFAGCSLDDGWSVEHSSTIIDVQSNEQFYTPVKIIGRISQLSSITPHEITGHGTKSFVNLTITDVTDTKIQTLDIQYDCIHIDLTKIHKNRTRCTFFGAVVPLYGKSKEGEFRFYLHDMLTEASPVDMIPWAPSEEKETGFGIMIDGKRHGLLQDHPISVLKKHNKLNGIISYIKGELAAELGIQALNAAPELERSLEFIILQACSQGRGQFLEKLHAMIIGPPNVGKAYLTKAALILNTVGQEISSNRQKITDAGLVGTVKTGKNKNVSEPGILPLNHGGVVCIQEFHDITGKGRDSICARFVRMMEEGQVIESTSAATVHPAETSLLIDMNRYSQIKPGEYNTFTDINIPVNMLARFDFIIEIPRDEQRSRITASQMASSIDSLGGAIPTETEPWKLRLRYLTAYLKSEYNITSFTGVQEYIDERIGAILQAVPAQLQILVEDMRLRLVRSVFKITKAVATANATRIATREHVDYALTFVQDKVNFICRIDPQDINRSIEKSGIEDGTKRREMINNEFKGKTFTITQVQDHLSKHMEGTYSNRTIERDLRALDATSKANPKGSWSLPK